MPDATIIDAARRLGRRGAYQQVLRSLFEPVRPSKPRTNVSLPIAPPKPPREPRKGGGHDG